MARGDWYRNTEWNDSIAEAFELKLKRAKRKAQYLRIQAATISRSHPRVAIELLDRHFALGKDYDMALALENRATAFLALGDLDSAVMAYEAAIEREIEFPNVRTGASLDLPYLIAVNGVTGRFDRAMAILRSSGTASRLVFPVERFKYHAARAIILRESDRESASREAQLALEAASLDHSGFRHHAKLGLVSEEHAAALSKLQDLCNA